MNFDPSIHTLNNVHAMGLDEGEYIGHEKGVAEERARKSAKVTALAWLCLIQLGFIALLLWK
jgi:hypothetical protein